MKHHVKRMKCGKRSQPNIQIIHPISDVVVVRACNGAGGPDKSPGIQREREKEMSTFYRVTIDTTLAHKNAGGKMIGDQEMVRGFFKHG